MTSEFKILVDRLKGGQVEKIEGFFDPAFFNIDEKDLSFPSLVEVRGEAYLSDEHLVIRLKGTARAKMPCAVCNEMTQIELKVENFYHTEAIEEIRDAVYDFTEPLREAFLIELPNVVECNRGRCPERASIAPYLSSQKRAENTTYFPFSDLN